MSAGPSSNPIPASSSQDANVAPVEMSQVNRPGLRPRDERGRFIKRSDQPVQLATPEQTPQPEVNQIHHQEQRNPQYATNAPPPHEPYQWPPTSQAYDQSHDDSIQPKYETPPQSPSHQSGQDSTQHSYPVLPPHQPSQQQSTSGRWMSYFSREPSQAQPPQQTSPDQPPQQAPPPQPPLHQAPPPPPPQQAPPPQPSFRPNPPVQPPPPQAPPAQPPSHQEQNLDSYTIPVYEPTEVFDQKILTTGATRWGQVVHVRSAGRDQVRVFVQCGTRDFPVIIALPTSLYPGGFKDRALQALGGWGTVPEDITSERITQVRSVIRLPKWNADSERETPLYFVIWIDGQPIDRITTKAHMIRVCRKSWVDNQIAKHLPQQKSMVEWAAFMRRLRRHPATKQPLTDADWNQTPWLYYELPEESVTEGAVPYGFGRKSSRSPTPNVKTEHIGSFELPPGFFARTSPTPDATWKHNGSPTPDGIGQARGASEAPAANGQSVQPSPATDVQTMAALIRSASPAEREEYRRALGL